MVNYADHPKSVAEIKSDRSQDCADWTPRDALIDLLRDIDSGKRTPEHLVLCWSERSAETFSTHYSASAKSGLHALGLLSRIMHRMNVLTDG